jgi:hypothetical protein
MRLGATFHQAARQLLPHALGHQRVHLARGHHVAAQRPRGVGDAEVRPAGREARQAQDAHGVLGEGVGHVAQHVVAQVGHAAEGVHQRAVLVLGDGVHRQVAPAQVVFERHRRVGMNGEAAIAGRGLALGAGQRMLLARGRVQEHREVAPDRRVALRQHLLDGGAHHDPVAVAGRGAQQAVPNCAADLVDLHAAQCRSAVASASSPP